MDYRLSTIDFMKSVCIIPARGGSKRIPRKNIKPFLGKPIIYYSIRAALDTGMFDEVMVSTDDEEIAEVAKSYGATVPFFRSQKNADDYATVAHVLNEVLGEYKAAGREFDYLCCIYPTAPFVTSERVGEAMKTLIDKELEGVVPVLKFSFPVQRAVRINDAGYLYMPTPEHYNTRSQDLEPTYHDSGSFYCLEIKSFLEQQILYPKKAMPLILKESEVQDIDTLEDWQVAEFKMEFFRQQGN